MTAALGTYGRVFDLIVVGRPGRDVENPRMPPLEAALFESGKPALIVQRMRPSRSDATSWSPGMVAPSRRIRTRLHAAAAQSRTRHRVGRRG